MFKNESFKNEIYEQLEINLFNQVGIVKKAENKKNVLLIKLCSIADKLDEMNFGKEAEAVTRLLETLSKSSSVNHGFNKLADEEFLEGPGEHKREKNEEGFEDEYLNILLGDGNYDSSLDEISKVYNKKPGNDDYLNTLLDTKSYDDILADLEKNGPDEDEVSIDY